MKEIWKDIKGFEGKYQASNTSKIRSLSYMGHKGIVKELKQTKRKDGYLQVQLYKKKCSVHRILAETFIDNPDNKSYINHRNGIKTDNRLENLEWCTASENVQHAYDTGIHKKLFGKEHHNSKKINQYDLEGNFIRTWDSVSEARKKLKANHISECCKGKRNKTGGYIWRYADED